MVYVCEYVPACASHTLLPLYNWGTFFLHPDVSYYLSIYLADISKSLDAKRKRLETVTQQSLKTSHKKVEEVWKSQQGER